MDKTLIISIAHYTSRCEAVGSARLLRGKNLYKGEEKK